MNREQLEGIIDALETPKVLIIGDLMLDRYITGEVSRISPEAPIPVLAAARSEEKLGGAGNVAFNLRSMDVEVEMIGVIGDDGWGRQLRQVLESSGISTAGLVIDEARPTCLKTRMVSGVQQMLRVDWEDSSSVSGSALGEILDRARELMKGVQAVVLSDYGKGVLTDLVLKTVIEDARAAGIPVLVDPKGSDFSRYHGATLITPNRKEAELALGRKLPDLESVAKGARELLAVAELETAVITLGAEGIYYQTKDGLEGREATKARAVFDVTGAGDTVISHLALFLAGGFDIGAAVALANLAAGVAVARLGTIGVTRRELRAKLRESAPEIGKVLQDADLEDLLAAWRSEGKRIVFTNGCFDIIHTGHVKYLRFSRSQGDVLIVGVNRDASVSRLKGPERPINTVGDRMEVLAAMEMVDAVISFGDDTPAAIIERVTPDVLVKGEDWAKKGVVGREWVLKHGGQVVLAPLVAGRSTTNVLERVKTGRGQDDEAQD
ncbi:MAG: D-beta-D-heptose 7-phosphate kinase/D-beta-D-heptose 1-phosphate adenosyltransferase [Planctomycetota bacterium]|jgi:D-beta-D-heptose 7-phosphate kinase/D-beta-D-heptose 1-phosphate adenosyltransferase